MTSQERGESERWGAPSGEPEAPLERADVGIRLLLSILFAIVLGVLETVIVAVVLFQLGFSLVTRREPSRAVRGLGNQLSAYYYRVLRFLTHNEATPPFPFTELEAPIEPIGECVDTGADGPGRDDVPQPSGGVPV